IDKAKSLLKISSPSRLFEDYGKWLSEGLAIGIDKMSGVAKKSAQKLVDSVTAEIEPEFKISNDLRGVGSVLELGLAGAYSGSVSNITNRTTNDNRIINIIVDAGNIEELQQV